MKGKYLEFIKIENENIIHQKILQDISSTTPYLGDLNAYNKNEIANDIFGNGYLVLAENKIIGYLGLGMEVKIADGRKAVSVYYGILKKYYGHGFGKLILNEISFILCKETDIDILIANVDNSNSFGKKTIESAEFTMIKEYSDEDETQYHRYL